MTVFYRYIVQTLTREKRHELTISEDKYRGFFESANDGIILLRNPELQMRSAGIEAFLLWDGEGRVKMKVTVFAILTISFGLFPLFAQADVPLRLANHNVPVLQAASSGLLTTEKDVNGFLDRYIERYTSKDMDGLLWLFSLNAIQNKKDELPAIRQIYKNFFHQTRTLRCFFKDRKIEIYENAVEVKTRYEIEQILRVNEEKRLLKGQIRWVLIKEDGILKILSIDYKHEKTH